MGDRPETDVGRLSLGDRPETDVGRLSLGDRPETDVGRLSLGVAVEVGVGSIASWTFICRRESGISGTTYNFTDASGESVDFFPAVGRFCTAARPTRGRPAVGCGIARCAPHADCT